MAAEGSLLTVITAYFAAYFTAYGFVLQLLRIPLHIQSVGD